MHDNEVAERRPERERPGERKVEVRGQEDAERSAAMAVRSSDWLAHRSPSTVQEATGGGRVDGTWIPPLEESHHEPSAD